MQRLSTAERDRLPGLLPAWRLADGQDAIVRNFRFADFSAAWRFLCRVALLAKAQDHHPEGSNIYNRVSTTLATHDAGGLTERDVKLAAAIDWLA